MSQEQPLAGASQRIDKWLFFARIFKSRTLAQQQIVSGRVKINGKAARQPSANLRPGDKLEITLPNRDLVLIVREPGSHRGPRKDRDTKPSQPQRFEAKPPRKEKAIDPDSPFAKLAALKEQMKK